MLATAFYVQLQTLINIQKTFQPFAEESNTLPLNTCKTVYILCNMIGNFLLFNKSKAFGLFDFFRSESTYPREMQFGSSFEEPIRVVWW